MVNSVTMFEALRLNLHGGSVSVGEASLSSNEFYSLFFFPFLLLENRANLPKYKGALHLFCVSHLVLIILIAIYFVLNYFFD